MSDTPAQSRLDRRHNTAINTALVKRYTDLVIEPVRWTASDTGRFMAVDRAVLTDLVRSAGIKVE